MVIYEGDCVRVTDTVLETPKGQIPIKRLSAVKRYLYRRRFWTTKKIAATAFLIPLYGIGLLIPLYWSIEKYILKRPEVLHGIMIFSASKRLRAYESSNPEEIKEIYQAISSAIAAVL